MAENTAIEWTDHTFNPWEGCAKVAAGCQNCYAETRAHRYGKVEWGPRGTRMLRSESYWGAPVKLNAAAKQRGVRARVFCASLADVFEDWTGRVIRHDGTPADETISDVRRRLFALIDATPWLDWQLCTKRPENIERMWPCPRDTNGDGDCGNWCDPTAPCRHRKNAWLLTSVATQADADRNVPALLKCRELAPVLGLSCEPLLGAMDLSPWLTGSTNHHLALDVSGALRNKSFGGFTDDAGRPMGRTEVEAKLREALSRGVELLPIGDCDGFDPKTGCPGHRNPSIDWVIAGGESGPGARPMHPDWARGLRDQCAAAGVPFLFKQWGEWLPYEDGPVPLFESQRGDSVDRHTLPDLTDHEPVEGWWWPCMTSNLCLYRRVGKKAAGRLLDGVTHDAFPAPSASPR